MHHQFYLKRGYIAPPKGLSIDMVMVIGVPFWLFFKCFITNIVNRIIFRSMLVFLHYTGNITA